MSNLLPRFRPELLEDLREVVTWYDEVSPRLGSEFELAFFSEIERISAMPLTCRLIYRDFRRAVMARFPYLIYFRVEGVAVTIFLLTHSARDPDYIRTRLTA